jgi:hypothetical protein
MRKKILIWGMVGLVVIVALIIFFGRRSAPANPTDSDIQINQRVDLEGDLFSDLTLLSQEPVLDYWVVGDSIITITDEGIIEKDDRPLTERPVANFSGGSVSFDGTKILVESGYPFKQVFSLFNIAKGQWEPSLPINTVAADFSPNSNKIIYLADSGKISQLILLDLDSDESAEVARLAQKDLRLDWIAPNTLLLKERGSSLIRSSLFAYNLDSQTVSSLIKDEMGLDSSWFGPDLGLIITKGQLRLLSSGGEPLALVNARTVPSKCEVALNSNVLYCAVPADPEPAVLPDSYLKRSVTSEDAIHIIPLGEFLVGANEILQASDFIFSPTPFDARNLQVGNKKLFLINQFDGKLYFFNLEKVR